VSDHHAPKTKETPTAELILELMARRIEDAGLYGGTDIHHSLGVAVPPTIIGAWEWARGRARPNWRASDGPARDNWHAACMEAHHRLAAHLAEDRLAAPSWWLVGQLSWEAKVVSVWGEMHGADEAVAAIRASARPTTGSGA